MALRLHESTQVRFAPQTVRTLAALSNDDKRYFAQKFQHPQLLDAESINEVPASFYLVRLQSCGNRRAVARHISGHLLIIALGANKKDLERFQKYRGCNVGINECLPLERTALAPFLAYPTQQLDVEQIKKEIVDDILAQVQEEFATREGLNDVSQMLDVLTACQDDHAAETKRAVEELRGGLRQVRTRCHSGLWSQLKALFAREALVRV